MIALIVVTIMLIGMMCVLAYTLAIYALPFMLLCGRPRKTIYVASGDMWRTGDIEGL
ncbi:MAG: hypothetical protein J0G34_11670 [Afipia sp.]|uniref:hypothetical protein n=1 Tax=Xanthobacter autotrophicus TaxID=280 RepID=UPI000AF3EF2A|nr:hypothetical protein [Afipia sp.]